MKTAVQTRAAAPWLLLMLLLGGCANLAPVYTEPAAAIPGTLPSSAASADDGAPVASPDLGWQDLIREPRLREAVALALQNNRDLRQAVLAIEQARATYRIQAAASWSTVNAGASSSTVRTPAAASSTGAAVTTRSQTLEAGISAYELDLFGRVRNLQDAALESFLQTEQAQRSTRLSLVAEVATAWLTLAADQSQLTLAQRTLQSRIDSHALTERRHALGADSGLTLAQSATGVESARDAVAAYQSQVQQDRNALDLLVGTALPPALLPVAEAGAATPAATPAATVLVAVPADLPSSVLQQRPDVLAAEHQLKAANANIGAARAARYPRISLTAAAGTASHSLSDLFKGGAWSFVPSITLPIFDGGAGEAGVRVADVTRDIRLAAYDKAVQTAFREVADALAVRSTLNQRLQAQQALVAASQRSLQLAQALQRVGNYSQLDVLDAQRTLYTAQQSLISLQLSEQANRVALFKAFGGGWRDAAASSPQG